MAIVKPESVGRPKGKKDSRPRKKKTPPKQNPAIHVPMLEITTYPRAGENKEFEGLLDETQAKIKQAEQKAAADKIVESKLAVDAQKILQPNDIAEFVSWPFLFWATSQDLPQLKITNKEAQSVAEPLANILNRHGVGDIIPPDALDGLTILARVAPLLSERFSIVSQERKKRAANGQAAKPAAQGQGRSNAANIQGAPLGQFKDL